MAVHSDLGLWIDELKRFPNLAELQRSEFFREHGTELQRCLNAPELVPCPGTSAHLSRFLRAVSWNIEKGIHWREIAETLRLDPYLRAADLVLLNEVDVGMARSGNVHVAREIAHALKMNYVFAPAYLELTKGVGKDLQAPGDNAVGLQGNAILSRYPLGEARVIELPQCHDCYAFEEKRYGRRIALWATVYTDQGNIRAVSTHLEVRETPACRARQMAAILRALESAPEEKTAVLLAGDWNTHSFARGTRLRTLRAYLRLGFANPDRLIRALKSPDVRGEPLFRELKRSGFSWKDFNDGADTCGVTLPGVEDLRSLPGFLYGLAHRRLLQHDHRLRFRLDWFAASGLKALTSNEETDGPSGVISSGPITRSEVNRQGEPLSDHDPILVDIQLPPEEATQICRAA